MTDQKKYKIQEFMDNLERKWTFKKISGLLKRYGITSATLTRDKSMDLYDTQFIPSDRLEKYAKLFNVSMEEMKNYELDVKPISEINPEDVITEQKLTKTK